MPPRLDHIQNIFVDSLQFYYSKNGHFIFHYSLALVFDKILYYLFIVPLRGRNFVHGLHLKWVPTFLVKFLILLILTYERMYDVLSWENSGTCKNPTLWDGPWAPHNGASLFSHLPPWN